MPYDPRRSRPTPKVVPDEESAPIDALLGPSPEPDAAADAEAAPAALTVVPPAAEAEPAEHVTAEIADVEPPAPTSLPTPVRKAERAPSPVLQLAPLLIAAALALIWLIRRRRR